MNIQILKIKKMIINIGNKLDEENHSIKKFYKETSLKSSFTRRCKE